MAKKLLIVAIVICLLFWLGIYLLIPNPLQVSSVKYIKAPSATVNELAINPAQWKRWWPGNYTNNTYTFNSHQYTATFQKPYSIQVTIKTKDDSLLSYLSVLPITQDSAVAEWKTEIVLGINPFNRIKKYNEAVRIKKELETLLTSLSNFSMNNEKMYGLQIEKTRFTNPFMISTQATFSSYPTIESVYKTITTLRTYAKVNEAQAVDSPMINIEPGGTDNYLLRAALPINKKLPASDGIEFKQMVLGNTLRGTVMGGRYKIEEALIQMQNYISDYRLTSPAIPFQLLITNRQQQPDSSKWITKLYYPIF